MKIDNDIKNQYYNFLIELVLPNEIERCNYSELLKALYFYEYNPSIDRDENRRKDAYELRNVFANKYNFPISYIKYDLNEPCTMLEMMVALANRIEDTIMYDPEYGNRIDIWFKEMLNSMLLLNQTNDSIDFDWIYYRIDSFNKRNYETNGQGSLFTINDPNIDMRDLEIWYQMQLYVSEYDKMINNN